MSSSSSMHSSNNQKPSDNAQPTNQSNEHDEVEQNYQPKSLKFWSIILGIYMAIFLVALDRTIIAVAIPAISNEFHSIEDIGWYGSAYMLTAAIFIPIFGRVFQIYSTKWTYLFCMAVFEIGSAICGAAPSSNAFILGRAIAGLGSAGIFSGGIVTIQPLIPLHKRPIYTAFFGMCFGISSILGPLVGGAFTDRVSWRWCFYINLPIGAFTMLAIFFFLHIKSPNRDGLSPLGAIKRLDPIGIFFFAPSMVCLILALEWGGTTYSWSNAKIIGLLTTFAVLLVAFIITEALAPSTAMAPARVVLNRSIAAGMVFMFLVSSAMMSILYYLTIWFQAVKNDSATHAGISTIPLVLSMIVFSIPTAKLIEWCGYYTPAMLLSPIFCAVGAGMLSTMNRYTGHAAWIGYQVLFGAGLGLGFQQSSLAAQTVLPRADVSVGVALMFFMQQIGGAVFLSVGQNIFSSEVVRRLAGVAGLDANVIVNTGATALRQVVPEADIDVVVGAYNEAIMKVMRMAAILSAVMIVAAAFMEWKSVKKNGKGKGKKAGEDVENVTGEKTPEGPSN